MSTDPHKPGKSLADYMVLGISPILIMLLVGSLSFFLIQVFYRGEALGSVRWVMFWFIVAVVLVSRIGIENGPGHAMVYGLALAAATWFYLVRIHPAYLIGIMLLGVEWWCANKLTRDCTLIDEDEDASGEGLLQTARHKSGATGDQQPSRPDPKTSAAKPGPGSIAKRPAAPPHPPGLWVVYFSLAALPLFGVGQMLLPGGDAHLRRMGLAYLLVYLAAALGLLLTTSFLGLRRYLRQRHLRMPGGIAFGWVRFGVSLAVLVLVAALLLPRPGALDTWASLRYQVDYQLRRASQFAAGINPPGEDTGRPANESTGSNRDNEGGSTSQGRERGGRGINSGQDQANSAPREEAGRNAGPEQPGPNRVAGDRARRFYVAFKSLLFLTGAILLAWWLVRRRELIQQVLRAFLAAVLQFFRNLFHFPLTHKHAGINVAGAATPKRRAFDAYESPFVTGKDRSWPPEQVILYSYEALRAWAGEQGIEVLPQQTAREFCLGLGERFPEVATELSRLSVLYSHAAYGTSLPAACELEPVRHLWRYLSESVAVTAP
jgi:Domain of unknown function (DUF4129)